MTDKRIVVSESTVDLIYRRSSSFKAARQVWLQANRFHLCPPLIKIEEKNRCLTSQRWISLLTSSSSDNEQESWLETFIHTHTTSFDDDDEKQCIQQFCSQVQDKYASLLEDIVYDAGLIHTDAHWRNIVVKPTSTASSLTLRFIDWDEAIQSKPLHVIQRTLLPEWKWRRIDLAVQYFLAHLQFKDDVNQYREEGEEEPTAIDLHFYISEYMTRWTLDQYQTIIQSIERNWSNPRFYNPVLSTEWSEVIAIHIRDCYCKGFASK